MPMGLLLAISGGNSLGSLVGRRGLFSSSSLGQVQHASDRLIDCANDSPRVSIPGLISFVVFEADYSIE